MSKYTESDVLDDLWFWEHHHKRSFEAARRIWIRCTEADIEVPPEVMEVFLERMKKDARRYLQKHKDKGSIQGESNFKKYVLYRYHRLWMSKEGRTYEAGIERLRELLGNRIKQKRKWGEFLTTTQAVDRIRAAKKHAATMQPGDPF